MTFFPPHLQDPVPAATSLLPGPGAADEDLTSMAQRIGAAPALTCCPDSSRAAHG